MARLIDAVLGQVIQAGDTQTLDHGKENPLEEDVGEPTQSSSGTQKTPRGRTFDFAHDALIFCVMCKFFSSSNRKAVVSSKLLICHKVMVTKLRFSEWQMTHKYYCFNTFLKLR